MKRFTISISVLLLFASFTLNDALAQRQKSLNQAVVDGDIDQVKSQISAGEDVNSKNRMGWTLLHTAIRNSKKEIVQLLIEKGADVNATDNRGRTPLHFAVESGQKEVVEQLIARKADINVMDSRADNALSLANKNNHKEIAELLKKHGAQEPNPEDIYGDRLYSSPGGPRRPIPSTNSARRTQRGIGAANAAQSNVEVDLLADPNEIKARVKTFDGLGKAVKEVSDKSKNEERQWLQTRYDNRTILSRYVEKQFEDEIDFIRKVAVEESAKKTVKAIDSLRTERRERSLKITRALHQQKRELREAESARSRTRGRTTGRNTRGRSTGRNVATPTYGRGAVTIPRNYAPENTAQPTEQLDRVTEEQLRHWTQATPENKLELAKALHPQIMADIGSVRTIAVEEKAKKTTAAIDGILLARKGRFDVIVKKMEEEKKNQQQPEDQLNRNNQLDRRSGRYRGRTSRRGTTTQRGVQQQNNTTRGRTRRR